MGRAEESDRPFPIIQNASALHPRTGHEDPKGGGKL